jgi:hypothetical protein
MPIGRPITTLTLSEQERTSLQDWARRVWLAFVNEL